LPTDARLCQRYYESSISFPVRTQEHVDYVKELRANQSVRLWIDRTKEPPRARVPTRASTKKQNQQQQQQQQQEHTSAPRGIDVDFMPSPPPPPPPPPFGGRRRLSAKVTCSPTESTSTSPQSENDEPSSNYQHRAKKLRTNKLAPQPLKTKARSHSPQPTVNGMAFLTHFFSSVSGVGGGEEKETK
jgi:hypothetical protein